MSLASRVRSSLAPSRLLSSGGGGKILAPPMVYISGEEMTMYTMQLIMEKWIHPHVDTSAWEFYDLSCKGRDATVCRNRAAHAREDTHALRRSASCAGNGRERRRAIARCT